MEVAQGGSWGEDVQEPNDLGRKVPVRIRQSPPLETSHTQDYPPFPNAPSLAGGRFPAFLESSKGVEMGEEANWEGAFDAQ